MLRRALASLLLVAAQAHADVLTAYSDTRVARAMSASWVHEIPAGTLPAQRLGHAAAYDAASNRLIVFGGWSVYGLMMNDVWVLQRTNSPGESPVWTELSVDGVPPPGRFYHAVAYNSAENALLVFGGEGTGYTPEFGDVWRLSGANGLGGTPPEWTQVTAPSGPSPRSGPAAAYDETNDRLIVFGGRTHQDCGFSEVWVLSGAASGGPATWTQLAPTGTPPAPRWMAHVGYDPVTNRLVVVNGAVPCELKRYIDVWTLSNANGLGGPPVWTQLSTGGTFPDSTMYEVAAYDPVGDRAISFRKWPGYTEGTDVLSLEGIRGGSPAWVEHAVVGVSPLYRDQASAVIAGNRLLMFGGRHPSAMLNDTWSLLVDPEIVEVPNEPALPLPAVTGFARPPSPNPSSGVVTFAVTLAKAGAMELVLHDVAGRRVRVMHRGPLAAGEHSFRWDGRGASGELAPSGMYFASLRAEGTVQVRRLLRLQ